VRKAEIKYQAKPKKASDISHGFSSAKESK